MLPAINLDNQAGVKADKVDDVGSYLLLALEFESLQSMAAQVIP